jgi:penicillin-binding protein 2
MVVVAVFFVLVVARLFALQVVRHDEYARFSDANQLQRERVPAPRGFFVDRHGQVLVDNVLHFQVTMSWQDRDDVSQAASDLAQWLPVDTTKIMRRFDAWERKNGRRAFPIVPDADKFVVSFVRENADKLPDLRVVSRARRRYRRGAFASHLLGYVGEVGDNELARTADAGKRYYVGDMVGKSALELHSEDVLRGIDGQKVYEVNASGRVMGEVKELSIAPTPGRNVVLTIDADLQEFLEEQLDERGPSAAVVMDVNDGSILAAASLPQFNPNEFATGISQESLDRLFNATTTPLFNRFSQARYPPASTFKIVSTHAILANDLVAPGHVLVYCTGGHQFGNRYFRCWEDLGHGYMNLLGGMVQSCDTYFYKVAEIMDVDVLASSARAFGLGEKTGIDLPAEVRGLVPDREYYDRRFGKGKWTQGLVLNNIIGQGEYLVSVLQMVRVCAAVANDGYLVTPHVIDNVEGEPPVSYPRRRVARLSGNTLRFIQQAMEKVVSDPDGTAHWTRLKWLKTAGKTGTAQNSHGAPHAWYVAYAPADDPEIAIAVIVENAGHGGEIAAPIARDFFTQYFRPPATASADSTGSAVASGGGR